MEILSSHNLPISLKDEEKEKEKKHFIILYGIRDESSYVLYGDFQSARSQQRIHYVNLMNMNAVEYVISSYNNGSTLTSSPMLIAITRHRKFVAELLNLMEQ
ncbi:MAG: hypothetical protein Q8P11_00775 [bacterium]|nr:hypothetical protein [bacterium]